MPVLPLRQFEFLYCFHARINAEVKIFSSMNIVQSRILSSEINRKSYITVKIHMYPTDHQLIFLIIGELHGAWCMVHGTSYMYPTDHQLKFLI